MYVLYYIYISCYIFYEYKINTITMPTPYTRGLGNTMYTVVVDEAVYGGG